MKRAAVALAIADEGPGSALWGLQKSGHWSRQAALILTRRAKSLRGHAGQWALPGGRIDEGETPEQTALRELQEEVGLQLTEADVLGRLDTFITRSGYAMTPIVVWAGEARKLVPNPAEVASIHRIRITEFLRADAPILEPLEGSEHPVLKMPLGDNSIAAPTAALMQAALQAAGTPHRVEWYPGAQHGFAFPLRAGIYDKPSAEGHWARLFSLFDRQLRHPR